MKRIRDHKFVPTKTLGFHVDPCGRCGEPEHKHIIALEDPLKHLFKPFPGAARFVRIPSPEGVVHMRITDPLCSRCKKPLSCHIPWANGWLEDITYSPTSLE